MVDIHSNDEMTELMKLRKQCIERLYNQYLFYITTIFGIFKEMTVLHSVTNC